MTPAPHPAQDGPPLAALLFRPGPGLAPEAHRVARALLEDAARNRGGRVSSAEDGAWRLVAAQPALEMARRALAAVLHGRDAALLTETITAPAAPLVPSTGLEAMLGATPLEGLLERRPILGFGPGGELRPMGQRALPAAAAIRSVLGARWAGAPWQAHAHDVVARRALALAPPSADPLHLDLPPEALPVAVENLLPLLPARALARPPAGRHGVADLPASLLSLLNPAHLPGEALHLAFDPALDDLPGDFWQALNPARVVLEGVADAEALSWGLARGILRFAGPWPNRLMAARRRQGAAG
ncbi:hypothetical protein EAH89_04305 [Roseomonas nepalensis]|uniref:Uncharacterized protein n=1 Tax=Muricoccus nepalensis TaxID=1854500 RepID=A0A502GI05_9PROT|nr:hypothetical protein [Roseomonas nepalensis]TPG60586.1 hypothetical protein EAH89_04305 [Roseomonas nepalensis]